MHNSLAVEIEVIMTTYVIITERNNRDSKMDQKLAFIVDPVRTFNKPRQKETNDRDNRGKHVFNSLHICRDGESLALSSAALSTAWRGVSPMAKVY